MPPPSKKHKGDARWRSLRIATHEQLGDARDLLGTARPDRVVLVDATPAAARAVEAYAARRAPSLKNVEVYALRHDESADDGAYAAALARERDAFVRLVDEKRLLVAPSAAEAAASAKRPASVKAAAVIVDAREFRAPLPAALHARGLALVLARVWVEQLRQECSRRLTTRRDALAVLGVPLPRNSRAAPAASPRPAE